MGYTPGEFIPCEVCESKAVDIHHIEARGMGGSRDKDHVQNLMALCRDCHERYGDREKYKLMLKDKHHEVMELMGTLRLIK